MMIGNKGEWSEIYTLMKVIADKQLYAGDSQLNKLVSLIFPIIKVLRSEASSNLTFSYVDDLKDLVLITDNDVDFRVPISDFKDQATFLLAKLQDKGTKGTFAIPEIESFLAAFNSRSIKAKSSVKSDIKIIIHDQRTGTQPELGFSIKSQLGGSSTLFNAAQATNFIYKIQNIKLKKDQIDEINLIDTDCKIMDRVSKIIELGGHFEFDKIGNSTFENNLILLDSALPKIIAEMLLTFSTSTLSKTPDLVSDITIKNPLNYNLKNGHPFYSYKIKRFLTDIALGMMPSKVWTGELDVTGGYLIVKKTGDVLCYHIYNRNEFENYLYDNTKLETASSTKHKFGTIYEENGQFYFKLNLQIRFL